jgi:hypothetical protein
VPPAPGLDELRSSASVFNGFGSVDESWLRLVGFTRPAVDLARADHRAALLRWLNSWGCRIRYPRPGEPDLLGDGLRSWWASYARVLPDVPLAALSDAQVHELALAYGGLASLPVGLGRGARTLGPTAAAKALYAMSPTAVMPWDAAIALHLHGARDTTAFEAHLRLGRSWAAGLLEALGIDEQSVSALVGRPTVSLGKIMDEHLYVTITHAANRCAPSTPAPLS